MIEKWFEAFTLLEKSRTPDGLGSESVTFTPGTAFHGALTWTEDEALSAGGRPVLNSCPALLHDFDVTLLPDDHVRREKDGAIYRVTSRSDALRSPAASGLRFAQVSLERVVALC